MEFLEGLNLVHGDVCSDNNVLSNDGTAKLTNFRTLQSFTSAVNVSAIEVDDFQWAFPEVKSGSSFISHKTDIYGLGLLMQYLLDEPRGTNRGMLGDEGNSTELFSLGRMGDILNECLQNSPLDRPSADELIKAIWDHLNTFAHEQPPIFAASRSLVSRRSTKYL